MPRNIQTFLPDGTLEGIRIVDLSESNVRAFIIPRMKLGDIKNRHEINQPALYFLVNSDDNQLYIGESENFFSRVKNHDQAKSFWDIVIAIVSNTNVLEKSDVKYLESVAVEKAKSSAAMEVLNRTVPLRNNVHEFKVHTLEKFLEDAALVAELVGFSIFATRKNDSTTKWYCKSKLTNAVAEFRGDKFVVLAGSVIDKTFADSWLRHSPEENTYRLKMFEDNGEDRGKTVRLVSNVSFKSPNMAGRIVNGRSMNAWTTWENAEGKTMHEIMRKGAKESW